MTTRSQAAWQKGEQREELLTVRELRTHFFTRDGAVPAVDGVSFSIARGEILGIVGESGSGKSVTARSIMRLVPLPGRIVSGEVWFKGENLVDLSESQMQRIRGAQIGMVLQEPMTSLNPVLTIGNQVSELFRYHPERAPRAARSGRPYSTSSAACGSRTPRAALPSTRCTSAAACASASRSRWRRRAVPISSIADEPTTALDVTIQAQVLELLLELRDEFGVSVLFITHDLGVVAKICDSVAVMYGGKIVEYADVESIFERPRHPYTRALLRSLPQLGTRLAAPAVDRRAAARPQRPAGRAAPSHRAVPRRSTAAVRRIRSRRRWAPRTSAALWRPMSSSASVANARRRQEAHVATDAAHGGARILELRGLRKYFQSSGLAAIGRRRPPIRAVDGVDFAVRRGENFGLVGESGSGKTTIAKMILRLEPPTDGQILFEGEDVNRLRGDALKDFRKATHVVFQDPNSSLSPRMRVADIVGEPLDVQGVRGTARNDRVAEVLSLVGLNASRRAPLPARVLGRSAAARRGRPRDRRRAEANRARRARLRARCVDPRADPQPAP